MTTDDPGFDPDEEEREYDRAHGIDDTVRPRLEAHGANLERVVVFDAVSAIDDDGEPFERPPSIPGDLAILEQIIVQEAAELVVVDPLAAFLNGRVDSHRDQDVR